MVNLHSMAEHYYKKITKERFSSNHWKYFTNTCNGRVVRKKLTNYQNYLNWFLTGVPRNYESRIFFYYYHDSGGILQYISKYKIQIYLIIYFLKYIHFYAGWFRLFFGPLILVFRKFSIQFSIKSVPWLRKN